MTMQSRTNLRVESLDTTFITIIKSTFTATTSKYLGLDNKVVTTWIT